MRANSWQLEVGRVLGRFLEESLLFWEAHSRKACRPCSVLAGPKDYPDDYILAWLQDACAAFRSTCPHLDSMWGTGYLSCACKYEVESLFQVRSSVSSQPALGHCVPGVLSRECSESQDTPLLCQEMGSPGKGLRIRLKVLDLSPPIQHDGQTHPGHPNL